MVSHNILKKEQAVRKCVECHNADSRLKASLYKYANLQSRSDSTSVKSFFSNQSYVIGAQQFPLLKKLSYLIFFMTIGAMLIHLIFRYLKKQNYELRKYQIIFLPSLVTVLAWNKCFGNNFIDYHRNFNAVGYREFIHRISDRN